MTGKETALEVNTRAALLKRGAQQSFRTLLGGPLSALATYLSLRSTQVQVLEILWTVIASLTTLGVALWCRKNIRQNSLTLWRFRMFVGLAGGSMVAMPIAFRPTPNSRQAALEVATIALSTIVCVIMTAADRHLSYAMLSLAIGLSMFSLSVVVGLSAVLIAISGVAVFIALAPLIETVYQPLRKNIELLFANEQLLIDLQRANVELSAQVTTDSLTGLANRLALDQQLHQERQVGILYLDLDHFKAVNDTQGHAAGDAVLLRIAEVLRRCTREQDFVARLGGDEFVILLDLVPPTRLEEIAIRIRETVQSEFLDIGISVSIGATVGDLIAETGARALARADRNLYEAKQSGRNQVLVH